MRGERLVSVEKEGRWDKARPVILFSFIVYEGKRGCGVLGKPRLRSAAYQIDLPDVPTDKKPYHKADIYKV